MVVLVPSLAAGTGCAPNTDLVRETTGPDGTPGGVGAAPAVLVDPSAGATGVPLNLASVFVRFPVDVAPPEGPLDLMGAAGRATTAAPMVDDCPPAAPGICRRFPLGERLLPSTAYLVTAAPAGGAGDGVPIGQFVTAADADLTPPTIAGLTVEPSGPCVLARFSTDEPASAALVMRVAGSERVISAGVGVTAFAVAAPIAAFGAGVEVAIAVRASDQAGNVGESAAVTLAVPTGLLPIAITEVHANPAGPEPGQEYVEIRNLGTDAVDVGGLSIEDAKGADVLPATALPAGAYALVVPSSFDPNSPVDTPPRAGTALIHVDTRLGADGLTNGGEVVRLRAGDGTIVSSYSAAVDVSAVKWSGQSVHRVPEDVCDQAASWSRAPALATPGWGPP